MDGMFWRIVSNPMFKSISFRLSLWIFWKNPGSLHGLWQEKTSVSFWWVRKYRNWQPCADGWEWGISQHDPLHPICRLANHYSTECLIFFELQRFNRFLKIFFCWSYNEILAAELQICLCLNVWMFFFVSRILVFLNEYNNITTNKHHCLALVSTFPGFYGTLHTVDGSEIPGPTTWDSTTLTSKDGENNGTPY